MCGIIGSVNFDTPLNLDALKHRGPDDRGTYENGNLKFGHLRLSIQDLSNNGHQPLHSPDGNYTIVFNGEIYNHWDIRKELEKKGHQFVSTSDTETILLGFVEYGVNIIPMLNGIFAFGIHDKQNKKLVVARDRFGVKPLYYFNQGPSFVFASELKALIDYIPSQFTINEYALSNYIRFLWSPGEDTPAKEIKKLLPGRYIEMDLDIHSSVNITRYYKSNFNSTYSHDTEETIIDQLDQHLITAVKRQMLSDVPIGFFLSGGLDSSLLVAIAKSLNPSVKLQCFTIETDLEHPGNTDDLFYARKVADKLKVNLENVKADVEIVRDFDKMIFHLDEPQADAAPLNVLNISKRAKEMGFKVLIGGTAGDDLFSGYRRHQALRYEPFIRNIPSFLKASLYHLARLISTKNPKYRRLKKIMNTLDYSNEDRMFSYFEWLSHETVLGLFEEGPKRRLQKIDPFSYFRQLLNEIPLEKSDLNKLLHLEMNSFLVDHNLSYTDKMGMAEGVEIRVPFLDNDLVEFVSKIPPHFKMKGQETKYILKKVAERYLPREVIYRDKTGFGAPVRKWVTKDLSNMIEQKLSAQNLRKRGIFSPSRVESLIERNKEQKVDASYSIWALLAIHSWLEQFIDGDKLKHSIPIQANKN